MFVAFGCALACGPAKEGATAEASTSSTGEPEATASGTGTTDGVPTGGEPAEWPSCEPWTLDHFGFTVGTNALGDPAPGTGWPNGHHTATCAFGSLAAEEMLVQGEAWWQHTLTLDACIDEQGEPAAFSLDLRLDSTTQLAVPLKAGQAVAVRFSFEMDSAFDYKQWYSLRDAATHELVLAAFADPGPTIAPKLSGEAPLDDWLAPFAAELGGFACPVEVGPYCEGDDSPQRAIVRFVRDGVSVDIVGGTRGDLGDQVVHLGFAGTPDACEGLSESRPIHGVLVRDP